MTIKVNYDPETNLVLGYYPDSIAYVSIPEPYVEISDEEHQALLGKKMCISNGVYQEYQSPESEQIEILRNELISVRKRYLSSTDWYVSRKIKRGVEIPQEIIDKDILAAQEINDIEDCITLQELSAFSASY